MQVMNRIYGTHHDVRSPLRKQMSSLSASFVERKADVIKMRNDDLMSFHAIGASLREFVEALLVRAILAFRACLVCDCVCNVCRRPIVSCGEGMLDGSICSLNNSTLCV